MKMQREKPLIIENGKVVSGYLALTPVTPATHYVAFVYAPPTLGTSNFSISSVVAVSEYIPYVFTIGL